MSDIRGRDVDAVPGFYDEAPHKHPAGACPHCNATPEIAALRERCAALEGALRKLLRAHPHMEACPACDDARDLVTPERPVTPAKPGGHTHIAERARRDAGGGA